MTTPTAASASLLQDEIIRLYEAEPDLATLPEILFTALARLTDADVAGYTEIHPQSRDFRALLSMEDDPERRARSMQAVARHMHSHPYWHHDPAFFGERALRESDFFTDEEFYALPIAQEAFLPAGAHRSIAIVMEHDGYRVVLSGHRIVGRPPFSDEERDRLQAYRPHALRSYRQAQQRTLAKLTPAQRLEMAFPDLTPRQVEVAAWMAGGKSNEEIATILGVGIDAVKAHVKSVYSKINSDNRRATAMIAHTASPFAQLPPLWKIGTGSWGPRQTPAPR